MTLVIIITRAWGQNLSLLMRKHTWYYKFGIEHIINGIKICTTQFSIQTAFFYLILVSLVRVTLILGLDLINFGEMILYFHVSLSSLVAGILTLIHYIIQRHPIQQINTGEYNLHIPVKYRFQQTKQLCWIELRYWVHIFLI